jgi:hypothetical protein
MIAERSAWQAVCADLDEAHPNRNPPMPATIVSSQRYTVHPNLHRARGLIHFRRLMSARQGHSIVNQGQSNVLRISPMAVLQGIWAQSLEWGRGSGIRDEERMEDDARQEMQQLCAPESCCC